MEVRSGRERNRQQYVERGMLQKSERARREDRVERHREKKRKQMEGRRQKERNRQQ
jgi:hypothetical protein